LYDFIINKQITVNFSISATAMQAAVEDKTLQRGGLHTAVTYSHLCTS